MDLDVGIIIILLLLTERASVALNAHEAFYERKCTELLVFLTGGAFVSLPVGQRKSISRALGGT